MHEWGILLPRIVTYWLHSNALTSHLIDTLDICGLWNSTVDLNTSLVCSSWFNTTIMESTTRLISHKPCLIHLWSQWNAYCVQLQCSKRAESNSRLVPRRLQATGHRPQATGRRPQATGHVARYNATEAQQATSKAFSWHSVLVSVTIFSCSDNTCILVLTPLMLCTFN